MSRIGSATKHLSVGARLTPEQRRLSKELQAQCSWAVFQVRGMKARLQSICLRYGQVDTKAMLVDILDGLEEAIEAARPERLPRKTRSEQKASPRALPNLGNLPNQGA